MDKSYMKKIIIFFYRNIKNLLKNSKVIKIIILFSLLLFVIFLPQMAANYCYYFHNSFDTRESEWLFDLEANSQWFPDGVKGDNITGYPDYIVPNIVHYVLMGYNQINFVHYLSFLSVLKIQKPDQIMIHCDCYQIEGQYWAKLNNQFKELQNKVVIKRLEAPESVYGIKYPDNNRLWHSSDILRNRVSYHQKKNEQNARVMIFVIITFKNSHYSIYNYFVDYYTVRDVFCQT